MKKALANTRVSVKLRKSEYREEWYLYVEAYPVFQADKSSPQRVREYLNRTITTPIWDKTRNARTDKDGKTTYSRLRTLSMNGGDGYSRRIFTRNAGWRLLALAWTCFAPCRISVGQAMRPD